MKEYTEQEINDLVADIQNTFNSEVSELLKSEEASAVANENRAAQGSHVKGMGAQKKTAPGSGKMVNEENEENSVAAKGEDSYSESSSSSMSKEESSMSKDEDAPPPKEGGEEDAPPAEAPEAPAPEAPPEQAAAPEAPGQEQQAPAEQDLAQAYGQLSDEELHAHYDAIKGAVMARMAGQGGAGALPPGQQPPPQAPPGMGAPPGAGGPPPGAGGPQLAMSQVEDKLEKLNKTQSDKISELEKQLEGVTKLFEKMLTAPQQKSVTTLAQFQAVAKSETSAKKSVTALSKTEITNKLGNAMSDNKTSDKDRDLVNRYFLNGDVKLEDLSHLL